MYIETLFFFSQHSIRGIIQIRSLYQKETYMGMYNPSGKEDVITYHSIQIYFETFCISQ